MSPKDLEPASREDIFHAQATMGGALFQHVAPFVSLQLTVMRADKRLTPHGYVSASSPAFTQDPRRFVKPSHRGSRMTSHADA